MEKRYQVFVSSTYADLKDERQKVIQTLMELDCIPSGMELFPAMDEEQWQFIKNIIDDCDYYLLIIGGRYGSLAEDGISYTEKEYDYAIEKGLKVIALICEDPNSLPPDKKEQDEELLKKLFNFIEKVKTGRLVKIWKSYSDIPLLVASNLPKTIKTYPAVGWVRANKVASSDLLQEINELRKENELLKSKNLEEKRNQIVIPDLNLANLDDTFTIHLEPRTNISSAFPPFTANTSWKKIFSYISPYLLEHPNEKFVLNKLENSIISEYADNNYGWKIDEQDFQTIKLQLLAYKLVNITYEKSTVGDMRLFWSLTELGQQKMLELRTVKK